MKSLFEDVQQDTMYRNQAKNIADKLISYIANNIDELSAKSTKQGTMYYRITTFDLGFSTNQYMVFYIHDHVKESFGRRILAGVDNSNNIHIFYDFENDIDIDKNQTLKSTLVHEIIHILDNIRSGHNIPNATTGSYDDYVNSSGELNAHYQEMIHEVEQFLEMLDDNDNGEKVKELLMSTPEKFIKFALNKLDNDYTDSLTDENLKKFKKRLYQYYQEYMI